MSVRAGRCFDLGCRSSEGRVRRRNSFRKGSQVSKQGVGIVIGRAVVDKKYRKLLKGSPHDAFEGYDLTGEEKQALARIDYEALEKLSESVDMRLQSWYVGWARHR